MLLTWNTVNLNFIIKKIILHSLSYAFSKTRPVHGTKVCLLSKLLFVFGVFVPFENFLLILRLQILALMAIEQWGFFSVLHLFWLGTSVIMVISEDPWHKHLLLKWLFSSHFLFKRRLRSVAAEIWIPKLQLAGQTL